MKIKLYSNLGEEKLPDLITVKSAREVPSVFAPETVVFPDPDNNKVMRCCIGAHGLYDVTDDEFENYGNGILMQVYGRALGNAGLFKINWGEPMAPGWAANFIMGLYDGRHDIRVIAPAFT